MTCWVTVNVSSWISYFKLFVARNKKFAPRSDIEHLITISTYKEPLSLLNSTIESIEAQELARSNINLTVSFEEKTPALKEKIRSLRNI